MDSILLGLSLMMNATIRNRMSLFPKDTSTTKDKLGISKVFLHMDMDAGKPSQISIWKI